MTETGVIISLKDINQKLGVLNMDEFKQLNKKSNFSFEKIISCGSLSEDIEVAIKMENEQITKEESIVGEILIRSEEHTSELQSRQYLVCRLLLEKKKKPIIQKIN